MSQDSPSAQPLQASGRSFAIVASRFNQTLVDKLVAGAEAAFAEANAAAVEVFRCPGALELPALTARVAATERFAGVVAIGVVIRGDTLHFELVAHNAVAGLARIAEQIPTAIGNCVIACDNSDQAEARAGGSHGNKGHEAAQVVLEMAEAFAQLGGSSRGAGF